MVVPDIDQLQYRPLITDATGRKYIACITNIRCKCEWGNQGPRLGDCYSGQCIKKITWGGTWESSKACLHTMFRATKNFFEQYLPRPANWIKLVHDPGGEKAYFGKGAGGSVHWYFLRNLFACGPGCLCDEAKWIWKGIMTTRVS